ncbi:MAG: class I SAM-dependent methyltransferase [Acidobacteriota bacterium]
MPAAKTASLRKQAQDFHEYLYDLKQKTPLHPALKWYPWSSLGQFDILDDFLKSDTGALLKLIGRHPVLDVGCGDGDISFFLESLGARVDAVDHAPTNYNALYGVRALKEALHSPLQVQATDIDAHPSFPGASYGLSIMLGVLYHLKNPFLVLEELARRSRYTFLSTRVAQLGPDRKTSYGGFPVAYLVDEDELNHDCTNFWIFSEQGFQRLVRRAGWDILHYAAVGPVAKSDPVTPQGDARAYILAKSRLAPPDAGFRLLEGWHQLEHDTWRWTQRTFSVEVDVADSLAPGKLNFVFHLAEPVLAQHPRVTLRARVAGNELPPITYSAAGAHEYSASVPSLAPGSVRVDFELDHAIAPSLNDRRELGLQVDFSAAPPVSIA